MLCFFGRGRDESLVILIKVGEKLILSYFLDLETFRVEAFFLQLLLVHVLFLLGILFPNPVNHLHSDYRLLIKYNKLLFIPILKPLNIPYTTLPNTSPEVLYFTPYLRNGNRAHKSGQYLFIRCIFRDRRGYSRVSK